MKAAKSLVSAVTLTGGLLSAGCATLEASIPQEVRYGKLYSLEESLATAAGDCGNPDAVHAGRYWADLVGHDLSEHMRFLDQQGESYQRAEGLMASLDRLQYSRGEALCEALGESRRDTQRLLSALAG